MKNLNLSSSRNKSESFMNVWWLHIGSNDVLGREIKNIAGVKVISHNEVEMLDISSFPRISISAFDPKRKFRIIKEDKLMSQIATLCSKHQEIIYISSCRVSDYKAVGAHENPYIVNKLTDENKLINMFHNVKIVYLPMIIPMSKEDDSRFFKQFFINLNAGRIIFDVHKKSNWNFVFVGDVISILNENTSLPQYAQILSKGDVTVSQLINEFKGSVDPSAIQIDGPKRTYPGFRFPNVLECTHDTSISLNWLSELREVYRNV